MFSCQMFEVFGRNLTNFGVLRSKFDHFLCYKDKFGKNWA